MKAIIFSLFFLGLFTTLDPFHAIARDNSGPVGEIIRPAPYEENFNTTN